MYVLLLPYGKEFNKIIQRLNIFHINVFSKPISNSTRDSQKVLFATSCHGNHHKDRTSEAKNYKGMTCPDKIVKSEYIF